MTVNSELSAVVTEPAHAEIDEPPAGRGIIQTNDVDLDYRGYIYITDRAGAGLHILEYTGNK